MLKEGLQRGLFLNERTDRGSPLCSFNASISMYFFADITQKVPIYVHFVEKLQTFDLRALGGSFCRKFGLGAVYTFL